MYCEESSHQEECISFAEENGFMTKEQAGKAKKFAGKAGPGGCKGPQECMAFCNDPGNTDPKLEITAEVL